MKIPQGPTEEQILAAFASIRSWVQHDQRAPHKVFVLLMALAQLQRQRERWVSYVEVEPKLRQLLADFGPPRKTSHPEHPFWRLKNDGIWEVLEESTLREHLTASGDVTVRALREIDAKGGLVKPLFAALSTRPDLVNRIATRLLETTFPKSLHQEVLDSVGFPWVVEKNARRDPQFRTEVLRAYDHRCAVCGFDARLGSTDLGLEAAHIKWHAAGGPDSIDNGLALCVFHHLALDRGALSLNDQLIVLVSKEVHGQNHIDELLLRYSGMTIRKPQQGEPVPKHSYLGWHRREVFRAPARN